MNDCMMLKALPFYELSGRDFLKATGAWVHNSHLTLKDKVHLFDDILESPDNTENLDSDDLSSYLESKYYSVKKTGLYFNDINQKGISLFHCNTRSLTKNLSLLNDILCSISQTPSIIAISETKLSENTCNNISIQGYEFLGNNSKTNAGGVGLYISSNIQYIKRSHLEFNLNDVESCWIELPGDKVKNMIIGSIYRHPSSDIAEFTASLESKLSQLQKKGNEIIILGDININFLNYNTSNLTSDYPDMLLNLGLMPIITKPTRITDHSATLIDHIYTNIPERVLKSGICLADISDHLPVFCTIKSKLAFQTTSRYYRDYSSFR